MALAASQLNERKRVKVYELRENDWFDRGTGFCAVQTIQNDGRIYVESEDEPERALLDVKIKKDDNYQRQQDTLIVWTDPDGADMALSFQEAEGCGTVWETISQVQQRLVNDGDAPVRQLMLPPPDLAHLPDIEAMIRGASGTQQGRDTLSRMIIGENYISKLVPLVEMAEDLEDLPDLHRLCSIMKTIILFNDHGVIEHVVTDDVIFGVVGALEYDPDFPNHKANHRQYLADGSKYKEVIRIDNEDIRRKIHYTFRLQYLKDVVLARILDDPTFSVLNSLIYFHQIDIVQHITGNKALLTDVFSVITDPSQPPQRKKEAVVFIQQCCATAKPFNGPTRSGFYQNVVSYGLFPTITYALQHNDAAVRVAGTEILVSVIDHDASLIRNYVYQAVNDKSKPLTDTLIELLLVEPDLGIKSQVADAIKVLLEPPQQGPLDRNMAGEAGFAAKLRDQAAVSHQNDAFLQAFFDSSAKKLFQPLKDLEKRTSITGLNIHEVSLYSHLVEILCFFIRQHSYRSKIFILSEGIASRTAQLISCPEKHMKLSAIKYFRAVINLNDEHHNRQMMQHRLFEPILNILIETMPRDNLLNSACLDLFEHIRRENFRAIIYHLVENYREKLLQISSVETFQGIVLRYDQYTAPSQSATGEIDSSMMTSDSETPNTRHVTMNGGGRWQGLRDADAEEDAYFNTSDNEDDDEDELSRSPPPQPNGASPSSRPLVDYGDDDDDDSELPMYSRALFRMGDDDDNISVTPARSSRLSSSKSPSPSEVTPTPPSVPISEKRRRDEDDEDELGKLSANTAKRRNSSSSNSHISVRLHRSLNLDHEQEGQLLDVKPKRNNNEHSPNTEDNTEEGPLRPEQSLDPRPVDTSDPSDTAVPIPSITRSPSLKRKKGFILRSSPSKSITPVEDDPMSSNAGIKVVNPTGRSSRARSPSPSAALQADIHKEKTKHKDKDRDRGGKKIKISLPSVEDTAKENAKGADPPPEVVKLQEVKAEAQDEKEKPVSSGEISEIAQDSGTDT